MSECTYCNAEADRFHLCELSPTVEEAVRRIRQNLSYCDLTDPTDYDQSLVVNALTAQTERAERAEAELALANGALDQFHEHKGWTANYIAQRLFDRARDAEDSLTPLRALADRMAEALEPFSNAAGRVTSLPSWRAAIEALTAYQSFKAGEQP